MAWTIKELAEAGGGRAANKASAKVENFRSADEAGPGDLTFVTDGKWLARLKDGAAAVISPGMETEAGDRPLIVADSPRLAFAKILAGVKPEKRPQPGIDLKAAVMNSAVIGKNVYVGPMAYVGEKAEIGDHTILRHGAHVSEGARVGENCLLYPHSYIGPGSILGDRVILGPGSSIGHDGFGYQWDGERHVKVPQVGIAVIEDDVEIGALSTVDRAMLGETRIGKGTKIDNLVIVAHNCNIGKNVILAGQVGLAGSVTLDDGVILGGQAGVADGRHLGEGVVAAGRSGIAKDIPPGEKIAGTPTMPVAAWLRTGLVLEKLPSLFKRMKKLEKRIKELEDEKEQSGS